MKSYMKYGLLFAALFSITLASCSDNVTFPPAESTYTQLFEKPGLVDSIIGTCSTFLIRTYDFDTLDLRGYSGVRLEFDASTDGDLSEVLFYYISNGTSYPLLNISGANNINATKSAEITSPSVKEKIYVRMKLFSSTCTGQYYHLKLREIRISGIN